MQVKLPSIWLGESRERRLISRSHAFNEGRGFLIRGADAHATKVPALVVI